MNDTRRSRLDLRRFSPFLLVLALACAPACGQPPPAPEAVEADMLFVDVDVLPMDRERVLEAQTVAVRDGRIVALGASGEVAVAGEPREIDGTGRYLMPGLGEMHGHLPSPETGAELTETFLFLYVANGLTTVRGMQGHPSQLELRERIESGELLGPRLILGSPALSDESVTEPERARELVREYYEDGYDLLKIHEGLGPEVYQAIADTAGELGLPFGGHVPDPVGLLAALEAGQVTIDHLDGFVEALAPPEALEGMPRLFGVPRLAGRLDESRIPELVEALNEARGWVVPTMVFWETGVLATRPADEVVAERPEVRYLPPRFAEEWAEAVRSGFQEGDVEASRRVAQVRRDILRSIHESGGRILLGTDSPQVFNVPGFSIHREMEMWVREVGMSPWEVLETGTRHVAEYLGAAEDSGTIAVGQRADLVLLESNPLDEIGNFADRAGVMVAGRWLSESEIQQRLEEIAGRHDEER